LISRLQGLNYNITCDEKVLELISKVGFDETYGARPIKRAIQDKIEDFISEEVLNGSVKENEEYVLTVEDEVVKFIEKEIKKTKKKKGTE
jgi:ATP-dependent Clp protease ATP-binding subunit ClpC